MNSILFILKRIEQESNNESKLYNLFKIANLKLEE